MNVTLRGLCVSQFHQQAINNISFSKDIIILSLIDLFYNSSTGFCKFFCFDISISLTCSNYEVEKSGKKGVNFRSKDIIPIEYDTML